MQNLIDDVTRRLVSRLPETKAYYSLTDLHDFQIPNFIISRIELELRKNLADSIVPPATDWANMKTQNVKVCWDNFIKAIHEQVRLPRSFARSVVEVAVADVLDLLIEPRKNMAEMIFGTVEELRFEELRQAAGYVTVYPFLPESLIKYVHRKQLPTISKKKASEIVNLVDAKLTEKYTPLNWAQLMDPLFVLLGEEIESEVFRLFFLDKGKERWATYFDKEKNDISRTRFIEILSAPELDGIEEYNSETESATFIATHSNYGKPSSKLVEESFTTEVDEEQEVSSEESPIGKVRDWGLDTSEELSLPSSDETDIDEESIVNSNEDSFEQKEDNTESNSDLNLEEDNIEDSDEVEDEYQEESIETESHQTSSSFSFTFEEEVDETDESEVDTEEVDEIETVSEDLHEDVDIVEPDIEEIHDEDDEDNLPIYKRINLQRDKPIKEQTIIEKVKVTEDVPFWKRFVSSTEEEPIIDLKEDENEVDAVDEILKHLKDMEDEFVSDIFGGEMNAYIEAIEELAKFKHWDEASNYIKQEIYRINRVEIYSESGLDFIERLQSYFNLKG